MAAKQLDGQVALVTGAAKRIGRSIALRLASAGAAVVVNYRRSKQEAEAVVCEIQASGREGDCHSSGRIEARGSGEAVLGG